MILKEEKSLTEGIVEIINELLTTLVYRIPLIVSEWGAVIFIGMLIQKINGFERALSSGEVAKLISIYTILPKKEDFKESKETLKFTKASDWIPPITSKKSKITESKTPNSGTSPWNTLGIPKDTLEVNFIGLNKEESNPWKPLKEKLISSLGTPNSGIIITNKTIRKTSETSKSEYNIYENTTTIRFGSKDLDNPFNQPSGSSKPVVPTFFTWTSMDNTFYYNFIKNKDKGLIKRKVTFR